jgi:Protein of unknown function (DUF1573)
LAITRGTQVKVSFEKKNDFSCFMLDPQTTLAYTLSMKLSLTISGLFLITAVVCFGLLFSDVDYVAPTETTTPQTVHVVQPIQQLGIVQLHQDITATYTIFNTSSKPILLMEPRKSCTCYEAFLDQKEVAPGTKATLTIRLNTRDRRGLRSESVIIPYRCEDLTEELYAHLKFTGQGDFDTQPSMITLSRDSARPNITNT